MHPAITRFLGRVAYRVALWVAVVLVIAVIRVLMFHAHH